MFTERKFQGAGVVAIRPFGTTQALADVGDVIEAILTPETESKEIPNLRGGGGRAWQKERLTGIKLKLKFMDWVSERMRMGLRGTASSISASSAASEAQTAMVGGMIRLAYIDPSSIVVKDVTDTTTYTLGTDYTLTHNGIEIPSSGSAISDTDVLHISYDYSAQKLIEAFVGGQETFEVHVDGLNDAEDDDKYAITVHKWQPSLPGGLNLLHTDPGELEIEGECLSDSTQGAGESKFLNIRQLN